MGLIMSFFDNRPEYQKISDSKGLPVYTTPNGRPLFQEFPPLNFNNYDSVDLPANNNSFEIVCPGVGGHILSLKAAPGTVGVFRELGHEGSHPELVPEPRTALLIRADESPLNARYLEISSVQNTSFNFQSLSSHPRIFVPKGLLTRYKGPYQVYSDIRLGYLAIHWPESE
jgi:hypothetical protein